MQCTTSIRNERLGQFEWSSKGQTVGIPDIEEHADFLLDNHLALLGKATERMKFYRDSLK